ncbi:MAG: glutamate-1-semialdehyde 2,1-aminomutase, partial [Phycisphaerae bacterium]
MKKKTPAIDRYAKSGALFAKAIDLMPGGVSSPVRSFQNVGRNALFIQSGAGAYVVDADGNSYLDYVMSFGPLILGHSHPAVQAAVGKQISHGASFGCCSASEVELAAMIREAMPSVEMVRFVNSGTEAVMSTVRLARGFTGRQLIVKMAGGYHGHVDTLLVQAGSGATTHGHPSSPGIPENVTANTIVIPFNDLPAVQAVFALHGPEIAALITEPVMGNIGVVLPAPGYLEGLRKLCDAAGALLIFDEVMTGFRVHPSGAQGLLGVKPDLTCLGKIIGGGLPVGAYGGRRDIMKLVSPEGPVYQAGTLSGNPLTMQAGITTLRLLRNAETYQHLEALGKQLEDGLRQSAKAAGCAIFVQRCGSMITPFFSPAGAAVRNYADALRCDRIAFTKFFQVMLDGGILIPPSQLEAWFISSAHNEEDITTTIALAG